MDDMLKLMYTHGSFKDSFFRLLEDMRILISAFERLFADLENARSRFFKRIFTTLLDFAPRWISIHGSSISSIAAI